MSTSRICSRWAPWWVTCGFIEANVLRRRISHASRPLYVAVPNAGRSITSGPESCLGGHAVTAMASIADGLLHCSE
jgi:hypothetical protein